MNRLKSVREGKGLTREELALSIDVKPSTIEKWEDGSVDLDISSLAAIVNVLDCRVSEILPEVSYVAKVDLSSCQFGSPKLGKGDIRNLRSSLEFRTEFNFKKYTLLMGLLQRYQGKAKKQ
ncbi:MAG: helix-turn-helix transcriptional regulator [Bdellovibrionota bacterium]|nr:helix-turn-helix transcriptional regulator [Bdellovibrionota bacterium]